MGDGGDGGTQRRDPRSGLSTLGQAGSDEHRLRRHRLRQQRLDVLGRALRRPGSPCRRIDAARVGAEDLGGGRLDALCVLRTQGGSCGMSDVVVMTSVPECRSLTASRSCELRRYARLAHFQAYGFAAVGEGRIGTLPGEGGQAVGHR